MHQKLSSLNQKNEIVINNFKQSVTYANVTKLQKTRMWADAQRDGHPAKFRWRPLRKFRNSIPCTMPQTLADARC